eukprot:CAMPEP_0113405642 /NCGR_PEP_ID=MMETSP0013_2-20120614/19061_1 /TAXON_ID=2843 ORGANISM="Skeletonema costatum, Strain 1716" /NCGR_SAMPLE_ID=MMETSP0013_2 /ASSEMBLY_ACC=CAM_ASM_000158 /LENGTH=729 /DNA_ID=CAMNT_0000291383 /DNA_START=31 /DNA_END=2220 /DNA_ORIENTATION=+ /assembly_acc=CAM_ASM_000158
MSFRPEKRSPFVDAPSDLANRNRDPSDHHEVNSAFVRDPTAGRKRPQLEPPPSMVVRSSRASTPQGGGGTNRLKYQQKISPSKVNHRNNNSNNNNNNNNNAQDAEMRARLYKAEAYEAKIRLGSQEQRMNTLKQELEELRFFAAVEQGAAMENNSTISSNHNDPPPKEDEGVADAKQMAAEKDAELIECLATELEETEKELKRTKRQLKEERSKNKSLNEGVETHSKLMIGKMQQELDAEKAKNEALSEEISLLATRRESNNEWQTKEAALNRTIENQQAELKKSKNNNAEVATTLREIERAVVRLQQELDAEKLKNQSLLFVSAKDVSVEEQWQKREAELKKKLERQQVELNKWKKDTADGVTIMREMEGALRKARRDNADLRAKVEKSEESTNSLGQLEEELKSTQNDRDEALRELSSLRDECNRLSEQSRDDATKYEQLVTSNEELQKALSTAQSQLEKKVEILRQDLSEAKEREDQLKEACQISIDMYEQQKQETDDVKSALDDMANSFEKQQFDFELKSSEMAELEEVHAASLVQHASELEASEDHAQTQMEALSSLQQKYQSQMLTFQSQIKSLREAAINNSDGPDDEVRDEIDKKLKLANEEIKLLGSDADAKRRRRLEREVSTLQAHVSNAEGTESRLRQQILLLSEELSETNAAYKKNISDLQQELAEMRAFSASSHYNSVDMEARDSDSGDEFEIKRKNIENDALQDYVAQRWQAFDPS